MGTNTATLTLNPGDPPVKALDARAGRKGVALQNISGSGNAWFRFGQPSGAFDGFKLVPSAYLDTGPVPPSDPIYLSTYGGSAVTVHLMEWF